MPRRHAAAQALWAALLLAAPVARANAPGMYEFGSRATAMGGGVSADVEDFGANYYNPAGLVRGRTLRLSVGYFYASHRLSANGRDNGVDPAHGLVGGLAAPGRLFGLPFAFGLGLHLPDDRLSRSRSLPQSQPRWELYDNRVQILYVAANLAVAPAPWLRIGGGMGFVSSTRGRLDITGQLVATQPAASRLAHVVDADLTAVRFPQLGVQVDVLRNLTLSAVYRGEYAVRLEIDAQLAGDIVLGSPRDPSPAQASGSYSLRSRSTAVFVPQQGVFGAAFRPSDAVTVVADVTWVQWSAYVNPTAELATALMLDLAALGNFPTPTVPPGTAVLPARFHDTLVPRAGVEWRRALGAHQLAVRGGYRYDPSPVPAQTGPTNFMDADRHVLSAGAGFTLGGLRPTLGGGLVLDVHAALQLLAPRAVRKASPADLVGDYVVGGSVLNLGATASVVF